MTKKKDTLATSLIWKQGEGWVQHNPPRHHPQYEEWMKMKEKEKDNEGKDD